MRARGSKCYGGFSVKLRLKQRPILHTACGLLAWANRPPCCIRRVLWSSRVDRWRRCEGGPVCCSVQELKAHAALAVPPTLLHLYAQHAFARTRTALPLGRCNRAFSHALPSLEQRAAFDCAGFTDASTARTQLPQLRNTARSSRQISLANSQLTISRPERQSFPGPSDETFGLVTAPPDQLNDVSFPL